MMDSNVSIIQKSSTSKQKLVSGHTYELGIPKSKIVRIYSRENGNLLTAVRSDSNGLYRAFLPYSLSYTIVSIDENKVFNAVVQDNVR